MSVLTAPTAASSAWVTVDGPSSPFERPSAAPTAIVDGTSVSTAKNAISAAWPVVRWVWAALATQTIVRHSSLLSMARALALALATPGIVPRSDGRNQRRGRYLRSRAATREASTVVA
jgi:hypothetical protein